MPASRLTLRDRQAIADGLTSDLSYAEIARRLDRPTSTITREVMRNGGPAGYRADAAHRATQRRARRSQTASPSPAPAAGAEAAERLTAVLVHTGMSRMPAAVLACLYTTDSGSLTAADLVRRLRVSPASISKAVGYLEGQELVQRRPNTGRRERYVIDDDAWYRAMLAAARTNEAVAAAARDSAKVLGPNTPAGTRLTGMATFITMVNNDIVASADRWRTREESA
ncbi:GbsR/MarR family transcriptional regulator [Sphaerisporangium fuscum]|uniref:GbsR/MarR family transcriptional regulator n=1 Tax=Sphaerisporangium fuscum TaxID=2835868 RepID=UPI001BDD8AA7|nr:helix-turn-helix domain-containing protein [Sphaerisporangium fuscum]